MLSHHEIATLILVKDAQGPLGLDPADLDTLLEHEFVELEKRPYGHARPRITHRGHSILKAVGLRR
ncbi:hypothetical protein [Cupriavidus sp. BIC8F]|uniref:hypothetical protein n=1 Tax=Cupriavidus sp. BIC8F TaxID=3079014 RepID=UPI0029170079|nr:hypothetical protein [Cupriavidus sp. BIC8F]